MVRFMEDLRVRQHRSGHRALRQLTMSAYLSSVGNATIQQDMAKDSQSVDTDALDNRVHSQHELHQRVTTLVDK